MAGSNGNGAPTPREAQLLTTAFKSLTHELRITALLAVAKARKISPSSLAAELNAPLGNVSYHMRQLADAQLVKLVDKQPRRGAIEHYYAITPFGRAVLKLVVAARKAITPEVQPPRRGKPPKDPDAAVKVKPRRKKAPVA